MIYPLAELNYRIFNSANRFSIHGELRLAHAGRQLSK